MSQPQHNERRATFRIAVKPSSGLQAAFVVNDNLHIARACNLSTEGIFIRPLDRRAAPRLEPNDAVTVEIEFQGEDIWLSGEVRARRDGGYGIYFPRTDRDGYRNPRDKLRRIVMELQRESITQRIEVLKLPEDGSEPGR